MREEIYSWMKNLAVFYIVLTAVMNLVPNEKYAGYIRYFTGLLLILLLCSPIFQLFRMDGVMLGNLRDEMQQARMEVLEKGDEEQKSYYLKAYEREIGEQIQRELEFLSYPVLAAQVTLAKDGGAILNLTLYLEDQKDDTVEEGIFHELEEKYQLGRERIAIRYS